MIRCKNISLEYVPGKPVLRGVSLHLEPGSFTFLTGASGAGKSSLLSLLALSMKPSQGSVHLFGENMTELAREAGVTERTFFRYFPSKESLLSSDDCVEPIIDAFVRAPADLSPVAAYRHALTEVFGSMPRDEFDFMASRQYLMYTLPEVKGALHDEYLRTVRALADAVAVRLNRPREDPVVPVVAGAMATISGNPFEAMTTITVKIVSQLTGDTEFASPETLVAFALGLSLFVITLGLNIFALYIVRKYREQYE